MNNTDVPGRKVTGLKGLCWLLFFSFSLSAHAVSFKDAQNTYRAGNIEQALSEVRNVLQAEPNNVSALFLQAQILSENKQNSAAIKSYQQLIQLEPRHLEAYNNLATIYAQQGKLELASKTLENAIKTDPIYNTIHTNLRAIYMDMSRKHYRLALKQKPKNSQSQLLAINSGNSANQIVHKQVQIGGSSTLVATAKTEPTVMPNEAQGQRLTEATSAAAKKPKPKVAPLAKTKPKIQVEAKQKPIAKVKQDTPVPAKPKVVKTASIAKKKPQTNSGAGANANKEIKTALLSWANAWSNRDAAKYVNAYLNSYATEGKTNADWVAGRRWNFKTKKYIKVALSDISIKADGDKFRTVFKQSYESDTFKDLVGKELVFVKQNGRWKIEQERSK